MPRHIEQPAFRHSKPASVKTRSSPSASAAALTAIDPGTTIARTLDATFLPRTTSAAARRSGSRPFVHEPMKTRSIATSASSWPGAQAHVLERARVRLVAGLGHPAGDRRDLARIGAPGDLRRERRDIDGDDAVVARALVRAVGVPAGERLLPRLLHAGTALEVGEGRLVGRDQARARAGLDRHVRDGHAAVHRERADGLARVLDDVARRAVGADLADQPEDQVLRDDAARGHALEADEQLGRPPVGQRLGREHLLDLARADAEREGTERAVRRGVRVAADDRHAGLRDPELGADHVHDALAAMSPAVAADAELRAVAVERLELELRELVADRLGERGRRHVVIGRRERAVGAADRAPRHPQPVEGLRAR